MTDIDAAHELNNLMAVLLGSLQQLQRQSLDDRGKAQLERARLAVDQANQVLQQLAGPRGWISQSSNGRATLHPDDG